MGRRIFIVWFMWATGTIGAGMALDARHPENERSFGHILLAITWPVWTPTVAVYRIVKGG